MSAAFNRRIRRRGRHIKIGLFAIPRVAFDIQPSPRNNPEHLSFSSHLHRTLRLCCCVTAIPE